MQYLEIFEILVQINISNEFKTNLQKIMLNHSEEQLCRA